MVLGPIFEKFVKDSPISVMVRGSMEYALSAEALDAVFEHAAQQGYTRELLFSSVVNLMGLVVCGIRRSVHAAYQALSPSISVSVTSVYNKLDHVEPPVSAALVRHSAERLMPVLDALGEMGEPLPVELPGYHIKILDGNHLDATEHRLKVLRQTRAAPLPGLAVVVLDPAWRLVADVIPCEDGHAQERSLTEAILDRVQPGDLWLGDRNFSTSRLLFGIADRGAFFLIRQHGQNPSWRPWGPSRRIGRIETGVVWEQAADIEDGQGRTLRLRRIVIDLDKPTRDGDTQLYLLTNLPPEVGAIKVANLYRKRWTVERMFQDLETSLRAQLHTMGYPKAALFGFCVALVAYNLLAVVHKALQASWGSSREAEVSDYYLADEVQGTYRGMMIAIEEGHWAVFQDLEPAQLAHLLVELAGWVRLAAFRRHPRGPKKPGKRKGYVSAKEARAHVSTARLLSQGG